MNSVHFQLLNADKGFHKLDNFADVICLCSLSEFEIICPLQNAVEMLDGLKVSNVYKKLTVRWCHMHINRKITGVLETKTTRINTKT